MKRFLLLKMYWAGIANNLYETSTLQFSIDECSLVDKLGTKITLVISGFKTCDGKVLVCFPSFFFSQPILPIPNQLCEITCSTKIAFHRAGAAWCPSLFTKCASNDWDGLILVCSNMSNPPTSVRGSLQAEKKEKKEECVCNEISLHHHNNPLCSP